MKILRGSWNHGTLYDCREAIWEILQDGPDNTGVAASGFFVRRGRDRDIRDIAVIRDIGQLRPKLRVMNENLVMFTKSPLNRLANGSKPNNANPQTNTRFSLLGKTYGFVEASISLNHSIQNLQKAPESHLADS